MYSMLLMSAMASGPEAPQFNGFFRNLFSLGGGCTGSCTGASNIRTASGCSGSKASTGCYGSCTGRTSVGAGSCTGRAYSSCTGSGYSSCCGGGSASTARVMTVPYTDRAMPMVVYSYAPPSGCSGGGLGNAGGFTPQFNEPAPLVPNAQPQPAVPGTQAPPSSIPETQNYLRQAAYVVATPDRATVTVRLPADATLYAEGRRLNVTGEQRSFVTPPLPPGEYGYTFRAEYVRGGEVLSRYKQVAVRAGSQTSVEFAEFDLASRPAPSAMPAVAAPAPAPVPSVPLPPPGPSGALVTRAVAPIAPTPAAATPVCRPAAPPAMPAPVGTATPARITVKLPPGAVLYVDGKRHDRTETVRRFDTPPVPAGQSFTYTVRVDMPQGSGPVAQSEAVTVRGGDDREVDFTRPLPPAERAGR